MLEGEGNKGKKRTRKRRKGGNDNWKGGVGREEKIGRGRRRERKGHGCE
jgi:hypothetical protein